MKFSNSSNPDLQSRWIAPVIVLIILIAVIAVYRSAQIRKQATPVATNSTENQQNVVDLVMKLVNVGAPIKQEEIPVVAKIKDVSSLKQANANFYKDAENADLIYIWSDRVVLFSQSQNKVLQYVPLIPEAGQQVSPTNLPPIFTQGASIEAEGAQIEIRNASGRANAGRELETALKEEKINVLAPKSLTTKVPKTLIIPTVNKPMGHTLETIVKATGGQLTPPSAQYAPYAGDILIVVGEK